MVTWAQRPTLVFLTVCLEDCKNPEIKVDSDKLYFKAVGGPEKKLHELTINLFSEVDPEVKIIFGQFMLQK
jgi:prostaglandin-E synthase